MTGTSEIRPYEDEARLITSAANADVKLLRSLHERKFRRKTGWFLAEGMRICTEAVQLGHAPQRLVYTADRHSDPALVPLIEACRAAGGRTLAVSPDLLVRISRKENAQMVIGAFEQRYHKLNEISLKGCWVALDRVRDPGNLGTIMRTVDAVGAAGIILIDDCTDPYSLEAVRASMGAVFNVQLVTTSSTAFLEFAKSCPAQLIGTALPASEDYRKARWDAPMILLMGNEQAGLPDHLMAACDQLVRMPMLGRSDSLNLAVSTGVALYEYLRYQDDKPL